MSSALASFTWSSRLKKTSGILSLLGDVVFEELFKFFYNTTVYKNNIYKWKYKWFCAEHDTNLGITEYSQHSCGKQVGCLFWCRLWFR